MKHTDYNIISDTISKFKDINTQLENDNLYKYTRQLHRLMDDEYKYGSSYYDICKIKNLLKKCNEIINSYEFTDKFKLN